MLFAEARKASLGFLQVWQPMFSFPRPSATAPGWCYWHTY